MAGRVSADAEQVQPDVQHRMASSVQYLNTKYEYVRVTSPFLITLLQRLFENGTASSDKSKKKSLAQNVRTEQERIASVSCMGLLVSELSYFNVNDAGVIKLARDLQVETIRMDVVGAILADGETSQQNMFPRPRVQLLSSHGHSGQCRI